MFAPMKRITQSGVAITATLKANRKRWLTIREITAENSGISPRTVGRFMQRYAAAGSVELKPTFPGYSYRLK